MCIKEMKYSYLGNMKKRMKCYGVLKKYLLFLPVTVLLIIMSVSISHSQSIRSANKNKDAEDVKAEHGMINNSEEKNVTKNNNPDAQWFPDAGLGLFIHWGIYSVKNLDNSWPMIPGRPLQYKKLSSAEIEAVVQKKDYNLNGKQPVITPNEFWKQAEQFNPQKYDPDKWIKAAKEAGFTYAVLTTKHHDGYSLWPSKFGDFSTREYMNGRDLIKPFIDACRKYGLKVGLYYSPPDWRFDKDYMSFLYYKAYIANPELPKLDADLMPRTKKMSDAETKKHQAEYAARVKGQVTELLTNWGKIDLLWFDGKAPIPNGSQAITIEEIRKLQPSIVINPRMHGKEGDYLTFERNPPKADPGDVWAEFCNTWTGSWSNSSTYPFRSNGFILGQLASSRAWGVNYLLGVGPTYTGEFPDGVYKNMKVVEEWMKINKEAIKAGELPKNESSSVPATSSGNSRYLFAIPEFKNNRYFDESMLPARDTILTLKSRKPKSVKLLGSGDPLVYKYNNNEISIEVPALLRTKQVDVIHVELID